MEPTIVNAAEIKEMTHLLSKEKYLRIVIDCPYCKKRHSHGAPISTTFPIHRGSNCHKHRGDFIIYS